MAIFTENYPKYRIDREKCIKIVRNVQTKIKSPYQRVSTEAENKNKDIAELCKLSLEEAKLKVYSYKNDSFYQREEGKNCIDMLDETTKNMSYDFSTKDINEATFINHIAGKILVYLENYQGIKIHGSDHTINESTARKVNHALLNNKPTKGIKGKIPDYSASIMFDETCQHHVFLVEVKPEKNSINKKNLVKLASMMKDYLDDAIMNDKRCSEYGILGLLIEGRECTLYNLDLPAPKLYRLTRFETFFLPVNHRDLLSLISAHEGVTLCCSILENYVKKSKDKRCTASQDDAYIAASCSSPTHHVSYYI
jgi:hypothetical protein